jgi:glycine cleavage system H protein
MVMNPQDLLYTKDHEWIRVEGDAGVVGITDHAQQELGDIVYVEAPEDGAEVKAGDEVGTIESVKAVSPLYSPLTGEVLDANGSLDDAPELLNQEPYGGGWIYRMRLGNAGELDGLMKAEDYEKLVSSEE